MSTMFKPVDHDDPREKILQAILDSPEGQLALAEMNAAWSEWNTTKIVWCPYYEAEAKALFSGHRDYAHVEDCPCGVRHYPLGEIPHDEDYEDFLKWL